MAVTTLRQTATLKASPHDVYEALMDSKKHSAFTGDKAVISRKIGGKFSVFGGYSFGVNLELIPDEKIVQAWSASNWKKGEVSTVTFSLQKVKGGARLSFTQRDIPPRELKSMKSGWIEFYWTPMKKYFGG